MTVKAAENSILDSIFMVRDRVSVTGNWPFTFVLFLERRDNQNGLRYDDCSVDCEGSGKAGDVGDQWFVSPDSIPLLIASLEFC
jgi:hypothetical protein